jgi:hypothetical protein
LFFCIFFFSLLENIQTSPAPGKMSTMRSDASRQFATTTATDQDRIKQEKGTQIEAKDTQSIDLSIDVPFRPLAVQEDEVLSLVSVPVSLRLSYSSEIPRQPPLLLK